MSAVALPFPPPLGPGARVRVVAPSGLVHRERFARGLERLAAEGLEPVVDDGVFTRTRYLAGDDARRVAELRAALQDESADAVWAARGGYGATRLLPHLAVEDVRVRPRWLVGFSDITALHALWQRAGLATLHGPNVSTLGRWSEAAVAETFAVLRGEPLPALPGRLVRGAPGATGCLLGGNLALLGAMVGTGYLPSFRGALLLIEDVGEALYRLDRTLVQLRQAGVLEGVHGVVVGQLTFGDKEDPSYASEALTTILDVLEPTGLPVLADVPVGHQPDARAVPLGRPYRLEAGGLVPEGVGG